MSMTPSLRERIESLLFVAVKPLSFKKLAELCDADKDEVRAAVEALSAEYDGGGRGVRIVSHDDEVQMATSPGAAELVRDYLKDEATGELTKPSLETLTIIAYRGPVSKAELEQIRGVNCSLILRNLMMRGLVDASGDPRDPNARFTVTHEFLRFIGLTGVEGLPQYDELRSHENVVRALESRKDQAASSG
jgi:segregation and condensation protein B